MCVCLFVDVCVCFSSIVTVHDNEPFNLPVLIHSCLSHPPFFVLVQRDQGAAAQEKAELAQVQARCARLEKENQELQRHQDLLKKQLEEMNESMTSTQKHQTTVTSGTLECTCNPCLAFLFWFVLCWKCTTSLCHESNKSAHCCLCLHAATKSCRGRQWLRCSQRQVEAGMPSPCGAGCRAVQRGAALP